MIVEVVLVVVGVVVVVVVEVGIVVVEVFSEVVAVVLIIVVVVVVEELLLVGVVVVIVLEGVVVLVAELVVVVVVAGVVVLVVVVVVVEEEVVLLVVVVVVVVLGVVVEVEVVLGLGGMAACTGPPGAGRAALLAVANVLAIAFLCFLLRLRGGGSRGSCSRGRFRWEVGLVVQPRQKLEAGRVSGGRRRGRKVGGELVQSVAGVHRGRRQVARHRPGRFTL